jgi:hypothetical protein
MFALWMFHPLLLLFAVALQFSATRRGAKGSLVGTLISRTLTLVAGAGVAISLWLVFTTPAAPPLWVAPPPLVPLATFGLHLLWGAAVVVGAGIAGWLGWAGVTRWFGGLAILSWILTILLTGVYGVGIWLLSNASFH